MVDVDRMYAAIQHAETGSYHNPYIRTVAKNTPGGSTAFGPVQITDTLAKDYVNKLSPESQQFYHQVLAPRYQAMRESGNNKGKVPNYNPDFDYGGTAQFDPSQNAQDYEQFAKELMSHVAQKAPDEQSFIQAWRGKAVTADPEYYKRVQQGKMMFDNEIKKLQLAQ